MQVGIAGIRIGYMLVVNWQAKENAGLQSDYNDSPLLANNQQAIVMDK